jgi:hypothetical protein
LVNHNQFKTPVRLRGYVGQKIGDVLSPAYSRENQREL